MLERKWGPVGWDLLSDRRGSRAWRVTGDGGAAVVKANNSEAASRREKAAEVAQEDRTLRTLTALGAVGSDYWVDAGAWEGGRWLAVRWIEGVPLWHALAPYRSPDGDQPPTRPLLLGIAATWAEQLAVLHAARWAHADVQPTNTLVTPDGRAALFDFALACGPEPGERLPYRGALTHTTAPEIAAALLATPADVHVQARPPADVWGVGASLFWCWTGRRPVLYADDAPRADKLRAIAAGQTVELDEVRPWPFRAFEATIAACLAPDPADRPTAAELADATGARR